MSKNLVTILEIIISVVVVLAIGAIIFLALRKGQNFGDQMMGKIDDMTVQIEENDYTKYDGAIVSGSDVIAAVKYFSNGDPISIKVDTTGGQIAYLYDWDESLSTVSTKSIANATKKNGGEYINPNMKYEGKVYRRAADQAIYGIEFLYYTGP